MKLMGMMKMMKKKDGEDTESISYSWNYTIGLL